MLIVAATILGLNLLRHDCINKNKPVPIIIDGQVLKESKQPVNGTFSSTYGWPMTCLEKRIDAYFIDVEAFEETPSMASWRYGYNGTLIADTRIQLSSDSGWPTEAKNKGLIIRIERLFQILTHAGADIENDQREWWMREPVLKQLWSRVRRREGRKK